MSRLRRWLSASLLAGLCAAPATAEEPQISGWRLLQTANPHGGADAVSVSHTADTTRSDLDLAGLMLRCHERSAHDRSAEIVIVVVTPFQPSAHPSVTIAAAGKDWHFDAQVVSPGAELLLPSQATDLAAGPWQSIDELAVKVSSSNRSFSGVIPIEGLSGALAKLAANCPAG